MRAGNGAVLLQAVGRGSEEEGGRLLEGRIWEQMPLCDTQIASGELLPIPSQQRGDEEAEGAEEAAERAAQAALVVHPADEPAEQSEEQRAGDDERVPTVVHAQIVTCRVRRARNSPGAARPVAAPLRQARNRPALACRRAQTV